MLPLPPTCCYALHPLPQPQRPRAEQEALSPVCLSANHGSLRSLQSPLLSGGSSLPFFFITARESPFRGIRWHKQKLPWHLHHPGLAPSPWNRPWSSFGFICPRSKTVIHLTYFIPAMRWITAQKHPVFSAENKRCLPNRLGSKSCAVDGWIWWSPCGVRGQSLGWDLLWFEEKYFERRISSWSL